MAHPDLDELLSALLAVDVFQIYRTHPAREPEYDELTASPGTIPLFLGA